jgi:hypothetical protein
MKPAALLCALLCSLPVCRDADSEAQAFSM